MKNFICVDVGPKYGSVYVERLHNMLRRNCKEPFNFRVLTDKISYPNIDAELIDVRHLELEGWWPKMALFNPAIRGPGDCVFLDLDTVVLGDLSELTALTDDFYICKNFTRLAGNHAWPCKYGSCVMAIPDGFGLDIWRRFVVDVEGNIKRFPKGDQQAIEAFYPRAKFFQDYLPFNYFLGYRELELLHGRPDEDVKLVIFAGKSKPANCRKFWVKEAWQ